MRLYETTFIVNPQTDDATIDRQVKDVADLITNKGGKIVHENRMGTRRMAYAIQGLTQGYYTSLVYEAPAEALPELQRHFRLGEAYIRDLTVLFEGNVERLKEPRDESRMPFGDRRPPRERGGRPFGRRDTRRPHDDRDERPPQGRTEDKPAEKVEATAPAEPAPATESPVETAVPPSAPEPPATQSVSAGSEEPAEKKPEEAELPKPAPEPPSGGYSEDDEL